MGGERLPVGLLQPGEGELTRGKEARRAPRRAARGPQRRPLHPRARGRGPSPGSPSLPLPPGAGLPGPAGPPAGRRRSGTVALPASSRQSVCQPGPWAATAACRDCSAATCSPRSPTGASSSASACASPSWGPRCWTCAARRTALCPRSPGSSSPSSSASCWAAPSGASSRGRECRALAAQTLPSPALLPCLCPRGAGAATTPPSSTSCVSPA